MNQSWWKRNWLDNWGYKAVSLLLAIMLWMIVNLNATEPTPPQDNYTLTDRDVTVQLTAKYDEDKYTIMDLPQMVSLHIEGTRNAVSQAVNTLDQKEIYVDLTQLEAGSFMVPVQVEGFAEGLKVRANPQKVKVVLEKKVTKQMNVVVDYIGNVPEGYKLGEPIIQPTKVNITAAAEQLDRVAVVQAVINVKGKTEQLEATVPLRAVDAYGNVVDVQITPQVVDVTLPITSPYKELPIKLTWSNQPKAGFAVKDITCDPQTVTVYGPTEELDQLEYYEVPAIDLANISADRQIQLPLPLVNGVSKVEPAQLNIYVDVEPEVTLYMDDVSTRVNGLRDGYKVEWLTPANGTISLTLYGTNENLVSLREDDVQSYIDVSNLPEGVHKLPVHVNLPPFVTAQPSLHELSVKIVKLEQEENNG